MEMTSLIDMLLGLVVAGVAWFLSEQNREQKRLNILLNKTREEYATKMELRDDMRQVMDALHREYHDTRGPYEERHQCVTRAYEIGNMIAEIHQGAIMPQSYKCKPLAPGRLTQWSQ